MKGEGEVHVAALQISSKEACMAQAADVAALWVECAVKRGGLDKECSSYAVAIVCRIQHPMVNDDTLLPGEGHKQILSCGCQQSA